MKNYNVLTLINFTDKEENKKREIGDKFKCTKERYEYLAGGNEKNLVAVELIKIDEEKKEEVKPKKTTKRKTK